jgi:hypothetical protein
MEKDGYNSKNVIDNFDSDEIKEHFYSKYVSFKTRLNREHRKKYGYTKSIYSHFFKLSEQNDISMILSNYDNTRNKNIHRDHEYHLYLNDVLPKDEHVPPEEDILLLKISENIKFKIKSPHLLHNIEIFKTKFEEIFSCVSRFHLPCVRGYYNGDTVYMLPSCITALQIYTNIDYKYVAGIRDPIEILDKYRMRGFGTIINDNEKIHMTEYNGSIEKHGNMFLIDLKNKDDIINHYGIKKITDKIFKPGKYMMGLPADAYLTPNVTHVVSIKDLYECYKDKYDYDSEKSTVDFLKYKTIAEDGGVNPFEKWILDAGYSVISKKYD